MDTHARFSTFLMALVTCIGPVHGQSAAPAQEQKPSITMTISLKQTTVKPGSEISVNVDITNASDKEVRILLSRRALTPYTFQVLDGTGKVAPVTPVGRAFLKGDDVVRDEKGNMRLLTGGGSMVPLAAGGTLHDTFVVTGYHDLSQPGEYTIRLQRTDPATHLTVTSNTVTLSVAN